MQAAMSLERRDLAAFFRILPVPGVGSSTLLKLEELGVRTVPELLAMESVDWLRLPGIGRATAQQLTHQIQHVCTQASLAHWMVAVGGCTMTLERAQRLVQSATAFALLFPGSAQGHTFRALVERGGLPLHKLPEMESWVDRTRSTLGKLPRTLSLAGIFPLGSDSLTGVRFLLLGASTVLVQHPSIQRWLSIVQGMGAQLETGLRTTGLPTHVLLLPRARVSESVRILCQQLDIPFIPLRDLATYIGRQMLPEIEEMFGGTLAPKHPLRSLHQSGGDPCVAEAHDQAKEDHEKIRLGAGPEERPKEALIPRV